MYKKKHKPESVQESVRKKFFLKKLRMKMLMRQRQGQKQTERGRHELCNWMIRGRKQESKKCSVLMSVKRNNTHKIVKEKLQNKKTQIRREERGGRRA